MIRSGIVLGCILLSCSACAGPSWTSGLAANGRQVALALNDPAELPSLSPFDPKAVPRFDAPSSVRPCCAFGMDLKAKLGPVPVVGYDNGNITSIEGLGHHGYGAGLSAEHNGLVYTCRGGFIDIAHIRDNADRMLFIVTNIVRSLPASFTFELPEEGTTRRVVVKALPEGMLERQGRWRVATLMAEWLNFQFSVWHEIVTWYGWESIKGFSEKVSAFSPEDLYSNVVGERIASGIIGNREIRSREEYNQAMDAWIPEALRRLGAVSRDDGRHAMKAVDGIWWDSRQPVTDNKLVIRRNLETGPMVSPWIVADSLPEERRDPALQSMCARQPPTLPLEVPERIGASKIEDLVTIDFTFTGWNPGDFPVSSAKGNTVTQAEFPLIIADVRRQGAKEMGAGFDRPGPKGAAERSVVMTSTVTK